MGQITQNQTGLPRGRPMAWNKLRVDDESDNRGQIEREKEEFKFIKNQGVCQRVSCAE